MPEKLLPMVETKRVAPQHQLHARNEVSVRYFEHEVEVVRHEAIGIHLKPGFVGSLPLFLLGANIVSVREGYSHAETLSSRSFANSFSPKWTLKTVDALSQPASGCEYLKTQDCPP